MVDVVVDAKRMALLPADPSTVPDAVKNKADAVAAAFYDKDGKRPHDVDANPEQPTVIRYSEPEESASPHYDKDTHSVLRETPIIPQVPTAVPTPAPADQHVGPDPVAAQDWKDRFFAMQGRYNASQKTIGEMQEQMTQLGNELLQVQRMPTPAPERSSIPPLPLTNYLTDQDVANYGNELIDLTQRAAAQVVAPQLARISEENSFLRDRLAKEARRNLDQRVELAIPNYREIDQNPRWHNWLLSIDSFSNRVRQQLLNEAISAADAPRVISFFRGFLNEEAATGHTEPAPIARQAAPPRASAVDLASLAAPGRARPVNGGDPYLPPEKPIYTRALISQLYAQQRRGAFVGRETEWARQEQDIIAAAAEGRVRN